MKPPFRSRKIKLIFPGDTIVEVMMSMAILSIVLVVTYSLSSRAFQSGLNTQYRDQAVSYTQQQLELIKEADNNKPATISTYIANPNTVHCIDPNTKAVLNPSATNCVFGNQYTVTYKYDNDSTSSTYKTFTVTTTWQSATSMVQKNVVYYKPNDSFTGGTIACTAVSATCATTQTNVPAVGVNPDRPQIKQGETVTITWNSTNVAPGSCTPSSSPANPGFNGVNANANPGTFTTTLTVVGTANFTITCQDNVGNPVPGSATVTVIPADPIVTTGSATNLTTSTATLNGTVNPNGSATTYYFQYGTTGGYGTNTGSTNAGAGSSAVGAAANISGLGAGTTYHFRLCATNAYASNVCGADNTFTTTVPLPSITGYSVWPEGNIFTSRGVYRAVYWSSSGTRASNPCYINNYGWVGASGGVGITVYPGNSYGVTCYNSAGQGASYDFYFSYYASYATLYQHAAFDGSFPGWTWGAVGEGDYGVPGDTSSLDVYGRAALHDNNGSCYTFQSVNSWTRYGFVEWYGLQNDNFGWISIGKDCSGY